MGTTLRRLALLSTVLVVSGALLAAPSTGASPPADPVFAHPAGDAALAELTRATARSLAPARAVRGRFVQRRYLAGLPHPLESSGNFLFARDAGIEWRTEQPFDSQFLLGAGGITQRDEGAETLHISTEEQPALQVVARVFFALFALDLSALAQDFELFGEARADGWVIGLKPRGAAMGSVFRHAIVSGGATVERVLLEDGNGDRSEILLREVHYDPRGMTADERRRF